MYEYNKSGNLVDEKDIKEQHSNKHNLFCNTCFETVSPDEYCFECNNCTTCCTCHQHHPIKSLQK